MLVAFLLLSLGSLVPVLDPRVGAAGAVVAVRRPVPGPLGVVVEVLATVGRGVDIHGRDIDHLRGADDEGTDDRRRSCREKRNTVWTKSQADVGRGQGDAQAEGPGEGVCLRGHHGDARGPGPAREGGAHQVNVTDVPS